MAYSGYATPALTHSYSSRSGYPTPRTPGPGYDDYGRYPYGDPVYDDAVDTQYAGYGDNHYSSSYPSYATPRTNSYYGNTYDDLALNRRSSYYGTDLDYTVPYTSTPYTVASGALTPSRSRRSSSVSFSHPSLSGQQLSSSDYGSYGYDYRGRVPRIKFRSKYANSGMSLSEAVNGVRPMGGDSYKWHDLHADRNGEIFLRVAWTGYRTITYRVPVDWYDGRVRLSSLIRRVARACIHYLQANGIQTSWDLIKIYSIEEVTYGTWQPQLTVKQW